MIVNRQLDLVAATVSCQKLLDRIPHLAWLMSDGGEILTVNQQWCDYLGVGKAALTEQSERPWLFTEILHAEERESWLRSWQEARSSQATLKVKIRLQSCQGNWEWFQLELDPDGHELGQMTWIGTAIKLGGAAAVPGRQQSPEFLEALLANASDGIVACDADGHLVLFNRATQEFHGLPPEPIEPDDWAEYYDLYDRSGTRTLTKSEIPLFRALQGESVISEEMMIKSERGGDRSILASGTAIYNSTGEKLGAVVLMRDITDYKQSIALQASEELFRHTFEHTPLGFAHVALDGSLLRVNQKFGEIVGYTQTELLATTFQAITEPADLNEDLALLAQLVSGETSEYTLEKRYIHKQGHHVWVNLTVALIRSISPPGQLGTPQYFLGAIKDISDRKQLEILTQTQTADLQRLNNSLILAQQQLQERNQELDRFVSIAAHDLKAPLRAISNLSEWIEEDLQAQIPGENPQLKLLRQRVKRMDALIDGLLRYSRAGKEKLEIEIVDVAEMLTETIDSLSPPASFEIRIVNSMPILHTKRLLLNQVFANLISNAIKHHNCPDGRIEITVEDLGDKHQFSIADDGPGIPEGESRERIFEIFQILNPTTDSTENTGIGLALVKKIVESEGGKIWLDNESIQGCRFYFTWLKTAVNVNTVGAGLC
jgi:PAS domain S-box-containing protein